MQQRRVGAGRDKEACMGDELAAQEILVKNWAQYSRAQKTPTCRHDDPRVQATSSLISCLDITRDADAIRKADPLFDLPDQEPKRAPSNKTIRGTPKR